MLAGASESLSILYRDDSLIAIHKPAGLLVHRSVLDRHETRFALQMLRDQIGQPVYPVHRLDKGTSGVLLFALDREVGRALNLQFEHGEVDKRYVAVVRGYPPESGDIDHPLQMLVMRAANNPETEGASICGFRGSYLNVVFLCPLSWLAPPIAVLAHSAGCSRMVHGDRLHGAG
ncbi:MAG: hypothetical protein K0M48_13795 [Thiobacillus sp.]|nr:hypothetical protein [Thiobacillus sp.]